MEDMRKVEPIIATIAIKRTFNIVCPHCGADDQFPVTGMVDDGKDSSFLQWYCKKCRYGIGGRYTAATETFTLDRLGFRPHEVPAFVLLRLKRGQGEPLWFIIEHGIDTMRNPPDENLDYLFESHHCPTNFIPVSAIVEDGDEDPHGLFEYVGWALKPEDWEDPDGSGERSWAQIFPQVAKGGIIIEGSAEKQSGQILIGRDEKSGED